MKYFDGSKLYPYIDIFFRPRLSAWVFFLFMASSNARRKVRLRSPGRVVDEMEYDIGLCPQDRRAVGVLLRG